MKKTLRANLTLFMSLVLIMTVLFSVPVSAEVTEHVNLGNFNTAFNSEKPEWTVSSTAVADMVTRQTDGENGYVKLDLSSADDQTAKSAALVQKTEKDVKIKPNTSYKLSFKAKADAAVSPYVYIRLKNTDGKTIEVHAKGAGKTCKTDAWTEFTEYFVTEQEDWTDTAAVSLLEIKLKTSADNTKTPIYYDDISIVEGVAPVVHTELLKNGSFNTNIDGWKLSSDTLSSYITHDPTGGVDGSGAVKFDLSTATNNSTSQNAAIVSELKLATGKIYRLTFSMKTDKEGIKPYIYFRNQWKKGDASGNESDEQYNIPTTENPFEECSTTGWTTYSCTFHVFPEKSGTALPEGSTLIKNELKLKVNSSNLQAKIWYDNVSIVEDYNECTFGNEDGNIVNSIPDDGKMTVKYHRVNNTDTDTTAALYFAVYEVQGNTKLLKDVGITGTKTIAKHKAEDFESSISIPDYSADKSYIIKAFLWTEAGSLVPIEKAVYFQNQA